MIIPGKKYSPEELYENVLDTVVKITTSTSSGSGFFIDARGIIATNGHVVENNSQVNVALHDGREISGTVIILFNDVDLAFVKADTDNNNYATLPKSRMLKVGHRVFAIGHPLEYYYSLTAGVVSAVGRLIEGCHYIQTDVSINPGNSGGPLYNEYAEVVGITTMTRSNAQGLGFAIPIQVVVERYNDIRKRLDDIIVKNYCRICGNHSSDRKYCDNCGAEIDFRITEEKQNVDLRFCRACKTSQISDEKYCPKCGTIL